MQRAVCRARILGVALIGVCIGCSRITVQSSFDPAASFQNLRTYAWKPGPQPSIGDPRVRDTFIDKTVRGAVDHELTAKGYAKSLPESADFLVAYDAGIDFDTSTVAITRTTSAGDGAWAQIQRPQSSSFERGMVVLLVSNPSTGRLMWRGVATGIFDPTATPETREQRITDGAHKLLEPFPPQ